MATYSVERPVRSHFLLLSFCLAGCAATGSENDTTPFDEMGEASSAVDADAGTAEASEASSSNTTVSSDTGDSSSDEDEESGDESDTGDTGDDGPKLDTAVEETTGEECLACNLTISTTQSGAIEPVPGHVPLASLELMGETVYALDEVGAGRVLYNADANSIYTEDTDCPLWEWLGQTTDAPRILSFGYDLMCSGEWPLNNGLAGYPGVMDYTGWYLPDQYLADPSAIAADYDVVLYCNFVYLDAAHVTALQEWVETVGGGLYIASEYYGSMNINDETLAELNALTSGFGMVFTPVNLDWGDADGEVEVECFPPVE